MKIKAFFYQGILKRFSLTNKQLTTYTEIQGGAK